MQGKLYLYNTLSASVEEFVALDDSRVKMYACGPTVYDYTHIGHIRKYVMDDILVRLLRYLSFSVTHVMNITDVGHLVSDGDTGEDKLEKGAKREGKTAWEVAQFYENYFFKTMDAVNVVRPNIVCRATEHIPDQIGLIQELEKKGFTYKTDDGIYFDSTKFPEYGKLARLNPEDLKAGARVEMVPGKKHPTDFALWKFFPPGQKRDMEWESPWGVGFPGWHIECSAMSMKYLGPSFDIHTGGIDHIPVHHTNEIAQSEAATGKKFVNYWIHHNFVQVDSQKMSKSLNNFFTIDDVTERGFTPLALRYLFLQTHYRQPTNFTWESLTAAQNAYKQLLSQYRIIYSQSEQGERNALSDEKLDKVNDFRKRFKEALRNDLNTPQSLGILWEIVKSNVPPRDKIDLIQIADEILGLGITNSDTAFESEAVPDEVQKLLQEREHLRQVGNWHKADEVRAKIDELGWIIEDTLTGVNVKKK